MSIIELIILALFLLALLTLFVGGVLYSSAFADEQMEEFTNCRESRDALQRPGAGSETESPQDGAATPLPHASGLAGSTCAGGSWYSDDYAGEQSPPPMSNVEHNRFPGGRW